MMGCHVPGPIGKRASLTAEKRRRRLEKVEANSLILKETESGLLLIDEEVGKTECAWEERGGGDMVVLVQLIPPLRVHVGPSSPDILRSLAMLRACWYEVVSEHVSLLISCTCIRLYIYIISCAEGVSSLITGRAPPHFRGMISGAPAEPNIGASSTDDKSGFWTVCNQKK